MKVNFLKWMMCGTAMVFGPLTYAMDNEDKVPTLTVNQETTPDIVEVIESKLRPVLGTLKEVFPDVLVGKIDPNLEKIQRVKGFLQSSLPYITLLENETTSDVNNTTVKVLPLLKEMNSIVSLLMHLKQYEQENKLPLSYTLPIVDEIQVALSTWSFLLQNTFNLPEGSLEGEVPPPPQDNKKQEMEDLGKEENKDKDQGKKPERTRKKIRVGPNKGKKRRPSKEAQQAQDDLLKKLEGGDHSSDN